MDISLILLAIFFPAIIVFIIYGVNASRIHSGRHPLPLWLLIILAILSPLAALCGLLFWGGRRNILLLILSIVLTIAYPAVFCLI